MGSSIEQEKVANVRDLDKSPSPEPKAELEGGNVADVVSPEVRKALTRKLDLRLIPTIMCLYLFSFLDRVNIGNAKLYGMEEDLGMTGNMYQLAVSILFVTYCLFEIPSNLVIKKCRPNRYIAFLAFGWGVVSTLTGICHSYGGLIAIRLIMGALEAGLFPGLVVYLTMFYTRNQLAVRVGYLFIASAVAGALGGMLAYAIGFTDGHLGMRAWRWLMIIEGIPSVILAGVTLWLLPRDLESAKFLTDEERANLLLIKRSEVGQTVQGEKFHWRDVKEGLLDWQAWVFSFGGFTNDIVFYGFSTFLPTIIKGIGSWSSLQAQALTVPCYVVGTGGYIIVARYSDAKEMRGVLASSFGVVTLIGYCMLIANAGSAVSYTGCFVVALGMYVLVGLPLAWLPGNKPRYGKRTVVTGMQYTIGNTAGIVMPFLYQNKEAPKYYTGYGVSIASVTVSIGIFAFMNWYYKKVNKRRADGKEDWKIEGKTEEEIREMGDYSPRYVYST